MALWLRAKVDWRGLGHIQYGPTSRGQETEGKLNDWLKKKKPAEAGFFGAVEKTRTSTGCPTATSTLRVYQFRHDRTPVVGATSGDEARERVATVRGGCKRLNRAPGTSRNQPILKTFSMTSTDRCPSSTLTSPLATRVLLA